MTVKHQGTEKGVEKKLHGPRLRIFELLSENPMITINELAQRLSIESRRVQRHIADLKTQGLIHPIGPDKGGHWEVVAKP
jgi:ATP-dependent DNA helicase RecG